MVTVALGSFINLTMSLAMCPACANTTMAEWFCCSMVFHCWISSPFSWKERGWLVVYASNILSGNYFLNLQNQQLKGGLSLSARPCKWTGMIEIRVILFSFHLVNENFEGISWNFKIFLQASQTQLHINILGKGMNPSIILLATDK